jgi:hypothetical protein
MVIYNILHLEVCWMYDIQLFVWTFPLRSAGQYKDVASPWPPPRTEEELSQIQVTLSHKRAHNHSDHQQRCSCQGSQRTSDEQWNKSEGPHEFAEHVIVANAVKAEICCVRYTRLELVVFVEFKTIFQTQLFYFRWNTGWSQRLCAPDDYSTKHTQKYFKQFQSLTMIT